MAEHSHIEWTDATWTTITGCSRVSPGCVNCYAERLTATRLAHKPKYAGLARMTKSGPRWTNEIRLHPDGLFKPLRWKRPRMIFVNSMSDTFHEKVPFEFLDKLFAVMALCPQHTFQVLTKRPERMAEYLNGVGLIGEQYGRTNRIIWGAETFASDAWDKAEHFYLPLPNVWLGTSVENQEEADRRISHLLKCPAAVRFLSCEPLLGPIDLVDFLRPKAGDLGWTSGILGVRVCHELLKDRLQEHWVIVGGESGPGKRPMDLAWARSIRDQCKAAGVPFFCKQIDKVQPIPDDLMIREWPHA